MSDQSVADAPRFAIIPWLGVALLVAALGLSALRVLSIQRERSDPGRKVVRIAHWQLEQGYREALQTVIDDYNRLHAADGVVVQQVPVTEKIYSAWLNTQLVADEPPELAQVGRARLTTVAESMAKFFVPLGDEVAKPNPYNRSDLLDLSAENRADPALVALLQGPWVSTLIDGMRGGYREEIQEFYSIPTTVTTVRLFYNADLLRQATGSSAAPRSLGALFDACAKLRTLRDPAGQPLTPISGSSYTVDMLIPRYLSLFTASMRLRPEIDSDRDGRLVQMESWAAVHAGTVTFDDPRMVEGYRFARELCSNFTEGFAGMERDQAVFNFIQGRAAMLATGSWDAGTLFRQAEARFTVGVCDFPLPAPGERWHDLVNQRANEARTNGGVSFGICKASLQREWAIDFMRYLTSQAVNQRFNQANDWLPVTIGASTSARMRPFLPDPRGIAPGLDLSKGGDIESTLNGARLTFLSGETTYDQFRTTATRTLADEGHRLWGRFYQENRDGVRNLERALAVQSVRRLMLGADADVASKRPRVLLQQMLLHGGELNRLRWRVLFPAVRADDRGWPW